MATSAITKLPIATVMTQKVEMESLPPGVFCRLMLNNADCIKENANKSNDKVWPVYSLSTESAEKVFGIELSRDHPNICIQIPGSEDTDAGRVDKARFLDVVDGNKEQIKEILQLTNTSYKAYKIWMDDEAAFFKYFNENSYFLTTRSVERDQDQMFCTLEYIANEGAKKTWNAETQCREAAKRHKLWPCHFFICTANPYKVDYYALS